MLTEFCCSRNRSTPRLCLSLANEMPVRKYSVLIFLCSIPYIILLYPYDRSIFFMHSPLIFCFLSAAIRRTSVRLTVSFFLMFLAEYELFIYEHWSSWYLDTAVRVVGYLMFAHALIAFIQVSAVAGINPTFSTHRISSALSSASRHGSARSLPD